MELRITRETNETDRSYIVNKLIEYNRRNFPDDLKGRYEAVNLFLKDTDGRALGGLIGEICWNWFEVQYLFVDDSYRRSGYGKMLLSEAERIAREKECEFMKTDTLSFQAIDFYKKQGFEVFGTISNAGRHTHYYLKKDL